MAEFFITDLIGNPAGQIVITDGGVESIDDSVGSNLLDPLQAVASAKVMTAVAASESDAESDADPAAPPAEMMIEPDAEDRYRAVNRYLISEGLRPVPADDEAKSFSLDSSPRQPDVPVTGDAEGDTDLAEADADAPFADVPVLPDDIENLTEAWVNRWAEWIASGRPEISDDAALVEPRIFDQLEWVPELHPRSPRTGQFVERSFDVPDDVQDFADISTKETLQYIDSEGGDLDSTVFDPGENITVDGVPNNATSFEDIPEDPDSANPDIPDTKSGSDGSDSSGGLDEEEQEPEPEQTTNWGDLDHAGFNEEYDRDAATETQPLIEKSNASAGVTASAMEVETLPDGTDAYVTNYGDGDTEAKPELRDREQSAYNFLEQTDNLDNVTPHTFDENGEWSASLESPGKSGYQADSVIDREEFVDAAAAQLISGDNDLHPDNIRVTDDGEFDFIDIDHSAGRLDEEDPLGVYGTNRERALGNLDNTADEVVDGYDKPGVLGGTSQLIEDIEERAAQKALDIENNEEFDADGNFDDNILYNIGTLADEARDDEDPLPPESLDLDDDNDDGNGDSVDDGFIPPDELDPENSDTDADTDTGGDQGVGDLPDVNGLGQEKADSLRSAGFESEADIDDAAITDIQAVDGVGPVLADRLKNRDDGDGGTDGVDGTGAGAGAGDSPVDVPQEARDDVEAALSNVDTVPESPAETSTDDPQVFDASNVADDRSVPLLSEGTSEAVWEELYNQASTPDEEAGINRMQNRLSEIKSMSYSDEGQAVEKAFDEALGGLPGAVRNDTLDGDDPTPGDVWAAERTTALHQALAERMYGDRLEVGRGVRGYGGAQLTVAALSQLSDDDADSVTFAENKFANYSPSKSVANAFDEGFIVEREISTDEIVHFNDVTNPDLYNFKEESEIAPTTGVTNIDHEDITIRHSPGAESERFFSGDPSNMGSDELSAWADSIRALFEQQQIQLANDDDDIPETDFYEMAREGMSDADRDQLSDIVRAIDNNPSLFIPESQKPELEKIIGIDPFRNP